MNKLLVLKESEDITWNEKYAADRFCYQTQVTELGKE